MLPCLFSLAQMLGNETGRDCTILRLDVVLRHAAAIAVHYAEAVRAKALPWSAGATTTLLLLRNLMLRWEEQGGPQVKEPRAIGSD